MTDIVKRLRGYISADTYEGAAYIEELQRELATLRAEIEKIKPLGVVCAQSLEREIVLRAENERLRVLVKDSVNLLDFLFEPGSYVPAVRLFCEKVKEELKYE